MKNAKTNKNRLTEPGRKFLHSAYQERFLLEWTINSDHNSHNLIYLFKTEGELDLETFKASVFSCLDENPILMTNYHEDDNALIISQTDKEKYFHKVVLSDTDEWENQLKDLLFQPVDLARDPLLKCYVVSNQGTGSQYVSMVAHRSILDQNGAYLFLNEVSKKYTDSISNRSSSPSLLANYEQGIATEKGFLSALNKEETKQFWGNRLEGLSLHIELPTVLVNKDSNQLESDSVNFSLSPEISQSLKAYAESSAVHLPVVMLALYGVALSKFTGARQFVLTYPTDRRPDNYKSTLGNFENPIPVVFDFDKNETFSQLIAHLKAQLESSLSHQHYTLSEILRDSDYLSGENDIQPFNVGFSNSDLDGNPLSLPNTSTYRIPQPEGQDSEFDINLLFDINQPDHLSFQLRYRKHIIQKSFMDSLVIGFQRAISYLLNDDQSLVFDSLSLLSPEQTQQILYEWNETEEDWSLEETLIGLFEKQVIEFPETSALVFNQQTITYSELDKKSTLLAYEIRNTYYQKTGNKFPTETIIALCIERSIEMVIGIMGILKAGGAYVPIDPAYPQERIDFILEDTDSKISLTNSTTVGKKLFTAADQILLC
ncbi:MAG: condensation domain-containing protein, partial [Cyclobacteriaceae bacterium]